MQKLLRDELKLRNMGYIFDLNHVEWAASWVAKSDAVRPGDGVGYQTDDLVFETEFR
jgi:hypothetical protein